MTVNNSVPFGASNGRNNGVNDRQRSVAGRLLHKIWEESVAGGVSHNAVRSVLNRNIGANLAKA